MSRVLLSLMAALAWTSSVGQGVVGPATAAASGTVPGADLGQARQEFMAAMQRVRLRLPEPPDSKALSAFVIYDYLVAARLKRDLGAGPSDTVDAAIDTFLQGHGTLPVTRGVRRAWLMSLAERHRWDLFMSRSADAVEPQVQCARLQGRLETGDLDGLGTSVLARWSLPQKQPPECDSIFAWARTQLLFPADMAEAQARTALAADNARLARDYMPDVAPARAPPLWLWIQLLESPKSAVPPLAAHPSQPVESDALIAGFNRLASADLKTATALLPQLQDRPDTTPALRGRLLRAVALGAAYDRDPGALASFDKMPPEAVDGQVQEWRVRAALWAGNFARARVWTEQMPAAMAALPRWRYWHARAVEALTGSDAAVPLYAQIAGLRDYYGYLAADRLHQRYNLNMKPALDDAAAQSALALEPGLLRAHALFDCDLADDAGVEWAAVFSGATPTLKLQAARLASQWGWYAQTIATLAQIGEWDDVSLRYPRPFATPLRDAEKLANVPTDWLLAVMRQESLFRKDAVSRADARGLMQMQPATATAVARRWHLPVPRQDALYDPAIAVPLGGAYLRELLDRYHDQLVLSLAAYNAGPNSVARWMPARTLAADIWIEAIPYNETRSYVQHILEHIVAFAAVRGAEPPQLATLLPAIEPPP